MHAISWATDDTTYPPFEHKDFPTDDADGVVTGVTFIRHVVPRCRRCPSMPWPLRIWRPRGCSGSGRGRVMSVWFVRPLGSIFRSFWPLWPLWSLRWWPVRPVIRLLRVTIRAPRTVIGWIVIRPGGSCSPWSVGRSDACSCSSGCDRSLWRRRTTW